MTIVAAAGNSAKDLALYSPGNYNEAITATNIADYNGQPGGGAAKLCTESNAPADDNINPKSNWAVSAADQAHTIAAPGTCPYTTKKGNRVGYIASGTSMAAGVDVGRRARLLQARGSARARPRRRRCRSCAARPRLRPLAASASRVTR